MRDGFIFHMDCEEDWDALTFEQQGILITALRAYYSGKELPEMDRETMAVFRPIRRRMDADAASYDDVCKKRSEAGRKGAEKTNRQKSAKTANAEFAEKSPRQISAKAADIELDIELDKEKERVEKEKPAPDTIKAFFAENGGTDMAAQKFLLWLNDHRCSDWRARAKIWITEDKSRGRPATRFHNLDERHDDLDEYALQKMRKELGLCDT